MAAAAGAPLPPPGPPARRHGPGGRPEPAAPLGPPARRLGPGGRPEPAAPPDRFAVSRRRVLAGLLVLPLSQLVGCRSHRSDRAGPPPAGEPSPGRSGPGSTVPDPLTSARADEARLLRLCRAAASRHPSERALLLVLVGHHEAQLRVLGVRVTAAPLGAGPAPGLLAVEEAGASARRHVECLHAPEAVAPLLGSLAAAGAAHRALLAGAGTSGAPAPAGAASATPAVPAAATAGTSAGGQVAAPGQQVAALNRLLAVEHSVGWADGVVGAALTTPGAVPGTSPGTLPPGLALVLAADDAHRLLRDELEQAVAAAGGVPTAAEPAYRLTGRPRNGAAALDLAAGLEDRLCAAAHDLLGEVTAPDLRDLGCTVLEQAAVRAVALRLARGLGPAAASRALPGR